MRVAVLNLNVTQDFSMGLFSRLGSGGDSKTSIECGDTLDIGKAAEFHNQLKSALGKGNEVVLNASELSRIDAASLQLCVVFFSEAAARKLTARWHSPSGSLIQSASLLGLSKLLGLPE